MKPVGYAFCSWVGRGVTTRTIDNDVFSSLFVGITLSSINFACYAETRETVLRLVRRELKNKNKSNP